MVYKQAVNRDPSTHAVLYVLPAESESSLMFNLFRRDPAAKLREEYARKRVEARDFQRNGDLLACAEATARAEAILHQLEELGAPESSAQR